MPTRPDIISRTSTLSLAETVELTEFLSFLNETYQKHCFDGDYLVDLNHESQLHLNRSYSCTPIVAESPFLLIILDIGTFLVHAMNPTSSRKLTDVAFMYRKKPASRLSRTAAYCHILSTSPISLQIVDMTVCLGMSLLTQSWDHRLRVAQVELKLPHPEGAVVLSFAQRYRITNAIDALKQSSYPTMGLYFFRDVQNTDQLSVPAIRWLGSVEDESEQDLFGDDNIEYRMANWMKANPCPEPRLSHDQNWRDDVDKACFGADWLSHLISPINAVQLQGLINCLYPDLDQMVSKRQRTIDEFQ